jgi:hypothetical protein
MLIGAACFLIAVGAFVWLHSGAIGNATCQGSRFVSSSGLSAWPPGARCAYGEPVRTDIVISNWFAVVVGGVVLTFAVARAFLISGTRSG